MARLLLFADQAAREPVAPLLLLVVVVLVVAAVVVSLCTSSTHAKLWRQQRGSSSTAPLEKSDGSVGATSRKHLLAASLSGIGGKAARMVSWNRRSPAPGGSSDDEEAVAAVGLEEEEDEAVWSGRVCLLVHFSRHNSPKVWRSFRSPHLRRGRIFGVACSRDKPNTPAGAIIMGDKCRPLQFSGHIAFDSDGNQLPAAKKAGPDVHAEN